MFVGKNVVWAGEEKVDVFDDGVDAFGAVLGEGWGVVSVVFVLFVLFFALLLIGIVSH